MAASVPGRAVYDHSGFRWLNMAVLSVMLVGGSVTFVQVVRVGDPLAIGFLVVWLAGVVSMGYQLTLRFLYHLEVDERRLYWRRRGVEESAALSDVGSVSTMNNLGTIRFRDDRRPLRVMVGGGFQEFLSHLRDLQPDIELGGGRLARFNPFGGGFSRS